jgi:hypothetical protein
MSHGGRRRLVLVYSLTSGDLQRRVNMRGLTGTAFAALLLVLSAPPHAQAFEMNAAGSSGPGDSAKFTDPDEEIEAMAGGSDDGSQSYGLRLPALGAATGPAKLNSADRSATWDAQHIRLVFGPTARYVHN